MIGRSENVPDLTCPHCPAALDGRTCTSCKTVLSDADWMKVARKGLGMSTRDFAAELDVSHRVILRWEGGSRDIPPGVIEEITELLSAPTAYAAEDPH